MRAFAVNHGEPRTSKRGFKCATCIRKGVITLKRLLALLDFCRQYEMYSSAHDLVIEAYNKSVISDEDMWDLVTMIRNWA